MVLTKILTSALLLSGSLAAQLKQVSNYGGSATSKAQMYVYVPDNVVENSPLVVVIHSCGSTAQNYFNNNLIPWKKGSDGKGYITVWPSSPNSGGCWDASSKSSLSHNGGGDSNAIANMITYSIQNLKVNASRVYVTGGSSGAMMSNILAATYPEMIQAVSLYSGVPAGCFVGNGVAQWNNQCSGGQLQKTPQAWADTVKQMYPSYTGVRPRMQVWHGSADGTLAPQNYNETIKEWTGVFGYPQQPASVKANTPENNYFTEDYGPLLQGIYAKGVGHSVPSHLAVSEAWFGL